jgi:hypothetical protein
LGIGRDLSTMAIKYQIVIHQVDTRDGLLGQPHQYG